MNLAEALNTSFTDLPAVTQVSRNPRLHPGVIAKEHADPDGAYIVAMGTHKRSKILYLTTAQWEVLQLFNGRRSCADVARIMQSRGIGATPEVVQKLVEDLDKWGFFYKTPQEESITLMEKLAEERRDQAKKKKGASDLYKIEVVSWDPDVWLTKLLQWVHWVYTPWFTALTVCGFIFMGYTWFSNWGLFWNDSIAYWNFTEKGLLDILEFYFIFGIISFIHECGHALTAKHFGAEVHRIGFLLIYTTPAAFVDSGQVWLYGGRFQRCITIMGGLWVEMILCVIATAIWWGTAAGGAVHDLAYKVVLIGGILPLMINLNPLMRLDGYLFLSEITRTPALKEKSVGFLSAWVRHNIFRLPVGVPSYPRRRQLWYATYAFLSGAYSYLVLLFLARITYKIGLHFSPDWAFLPAMLVAARIFKSRILKFRDFLRTLYLDKKELMFAHRKSLIAVAAAVLVFLCIPLWHESLQADFLLEPIQKAIIRTHVPGKIAGVMVEEGDRVDGGAPLATLRDAGMESEVAQAYSSANLAAAHLTQAELNYGDIGSAGAEHRAAAVHLKAVEAKQLSMTLSTPIAGVVVTPRMHDLAGAYVPAGTVIAEVDDISRMRARVFVPQAEVHVLTNITGASLHVPALAGPVHGTVVSVSPADEEIAAGLEAANKIQGFQPGAHYVVTVVVPNDGRLTAGMSGTARIYGRRRSAIGLALQPVLDFAGRKLW
jgi:putative peptide zinc metalloprotease protein